jgi:hypothetical protein
LKFEHLVFQLWKKTRLLSVKEFSLSVIILINLLKLTAQSQGINKLSLIL